MSDLIYNQRDIPAEQWRYGFRTSADTGCGWIATYNALALMGYRVNPEALIHYYEWMIPFVHGNLGTTALAPARFFRQHGFGVETTACADGFDRLAKESDVCILFYHWRRGCRLGAHFVAVQYRDGCFTGYNTFRTSSGPDDYGASLEAFIRAHHFHAPVLIGIRDKKA